MSESRIYKFSRLASLLIIAALLAAPLLSRAQEAEKISATSNSVSAAAKRILSLIKKAGLSKVPTASAALSQNASTSSYRYQCADSFDVSGTPPTLPTIATSQIEGIFWRPNVVQSISDGSANVVQCREFFSSDHDGFSGGLGACHMAEAVGRSFEIVLQAGVSSCYMQNFPTKTNLRAGGITVVKGKLPNNDITKIFTPGDEQRLVKIITPKINEEGQAESIFVKIPSLSSNTKSNRLYRADLYFCPAGQNAPRGFNTITISNDRILTTVVKNNSDPFSNSSNIASVSGTLYRDNNSIKWDTTKDRTVDVQFSHDTEIAKSTFNITSDNQIILKRRNTRGSDLHKDYLIAHFTGSSAIDVAFLEGAFKGQADFGQHSNTFLGATAYRDTYYAAEPSNALLAEVQNYDFTTDSFYTSEPALTIDTSKYSCSSKPNIVLRMNQNETLEESLSPCFSNRLRNMDFCRTSTLVNSAQQNYFSSCGPNQGPGGG